MWSASEGRGSRQPAHELAGLLRLGHAAATTMGAAPLRGELERLARLGRVELDRDRPGGADDTPEDDTPPAAAAVESLGLTARELEVLALVAEGRSNRQVADALFISAKTASVHVSNILAKLGVASRVEAAAVAHRLGLTGGRPGS